MQTITVRGGTLFDIACRYLGDAAAWTSIASLNDIKDPWLSDVVTLVLPASAGQSSNGA